MSPQHQRGDGGGAKMQASGEKDAVEVDEEQTTLIAEVSATDRRVAKHD